MRPWANQAYLAHKGNLAYFAHQAHKAHPAHQAHSAMLMLDCPDDFRR